MATSEPLLGSEPVKQPFFSVSKEFFLKHFPGRKDDAVEIFNILNFADGDDWLDINDVKAFWSEMSNISDMDGDGDIDLDDAKLASKRLGELLKNVKDPVEFEKMRSYVKQTAFFKMDTMSIIIFFLMIFGSIYFVYYIVCFGAGLVWSMIFNLILSWVMFMVILGWIFGYRRLIPFFRALCVLVDHTSKALPNP